VGHVAVKHCFKLLSFLHLYQLHSVLLAPLSDMLPLEYELMYRTGVFIRKCLDVKNKIVGSVTRNCIFFQRMKSPIGCNAQFGVRTLRT